jgi:disulfide bond formation protein DsbB
MTQLKPRSVALLVGATSALLLLGAFAFQHIGGLSPCPLCLQQRWTHVAIMLACALVYARPARWTIALAILASTAAVALALYHSGVEMKWWAGPQGCSGVAEDMSGMGGAALLSLESVAPIVKCTEVAWSLFGVSMAGWNGIITLAAGILWIPVLRSS